MQELGMVFWLWVLTAELLLFDIALAIERLI